MQLTPLLLKRNGIHHLGTNTRRALNNHAISASYFTYYIIEQLTTEVRLDKLECWILIIRSPMLAGLYINDELVNEA